MTLFFYYQKDTLYCENMKRALYPKQFYLSLTQNSWWPRPHSARIRTGRSNASNLVSPTPLYRAAAAAAFRSVSSRRRRSHLSLSSPSLPYPSMGALRSLSNQRLSISSPSDGQIRAPRLGGPSPLSELSLTAATGRSSKMTTIMPITEAIAGGVEWI